MNFACAKCGQKIEAPDNMAGQRAECPGCGVALEIPQAGPPPLPQKPPATDTYACPYCGEQILSIAKKCKHCGEFLDAELRQQAQKQSAPQVVQIARAPRNQVIYVLLGLCLGGLVGLHNFYARRYIQGVIQLIIIAIIGLALEWVIVAVLINAIWVFREIFTVANDGDDQPMIDAQKSKKVALWFGIPLAIIFILLLLCILDQQATSDLLRF